MTCRNLRHLRLLVAVADERSLTGAAGRMRISQPAVTQALGKLESDFGGALFDRVSGGVDPTRRGMVVVGRVRRALAILDPALERVAPRLKLVATASQLQTLVTVRETENFTLAARRLGVSQPTVHRAVTQLEQDAGRHLFERTSFGMLATRQARALAQAAMLAFRELEQAASDLAELDGNEVGRIVVGALPLSRSAVLPRALVEFRRQRPRQPLRVVDGLYDDLLAGLRRGDIDVVVGALRDPVPIGDVVQERLFGDRMSIIAGNHHPFHGRGHIPMPELHACSWVVPRAETPARRQFDDLFGALGPPASIIETGSILLMREILCESDHLGCISRIQARAELAKGLVREIDVETHWIERPIGLTYRASWSPTLAQSLLLELLRSVAGTDARGFDA